MTQDHDSSESPTVDLNRRNTTMAFLFTLALTAYVYYPVLVHMILTWKVDPDYSHGFLIVPLSLYFAYGKTPKLRKAKIEGSWWGAAILAFGVAALCFGVLGGLLTSLRSGFVITLIGLVLLLAGKEVFKILLFPLCFLFLMVPLPQTLVNIIAFPLQLIAANWAVLALQNMGIPSLLEGNIIHLAHTELFVAQACSGLRSLMALLTLGVVFAQFFRPGKLGEQVLLVCSTIPIAIFVNALRVTLTGLLTHNFGREAAGGFIHEFQGMITFSMAFFLLLAEARLISAAVNGFRGQSRKRAA